VRLSTGVYPSMSVWGSGRPRQDQQGSAKLRAAHIGRMRPALRSLQEVNAAVKSVRGWRPMVALLSERGSAMDAENISFLFLKVCQCSVRSCLLS
jgi:hypothetical protein